MRQFKQLTNDEISEAAKQNSTLTGVLQFLDCSSCSKNCSKLKQKLQELQVPLLSSSKLTKEEYEQNPKYCKTCGAIIPYEKRRNHYCNASCAAITTNKNRNHKLNKTCKICGKTINSRSNFCSNTCFQEYKQQQQVENWRAGLILGTKGQSGVATFIRTYLKNKYNNSCQLCGWNEVHPITGNVPLQIHHIDGDCTNNKEENLQLLCPNCHSLTENFGKRNKNCTRIDKRYKKYQ